MRKRNLILVANLIAVCCLLTAMPATAKQKDGWRAYKLGLENVYACAFTPGSRAVAFLYRTDHQVSEKPWKVVYTSHLALWHFETGKIDEKLKWDYTSTNEGDPWWSQSRYVKYTADGRYLVILDPTAIRVLDARTFVELKEIAYQPPKAPVPFKGVVWTTVGLSLASNGSRAAVAISSSGGGGGGFVRIYDLRTGQIIQKWQFRHGVYSVSGVALSPDGDRVVLSLQPSAGSSDPEAFIPAGMDNVRVMDVKTGETLAGVSTKYFAGPVLFGPDDTLLTGSTNDDRTGYKYDSVKIWNARTGKLLREIAAPRTGVHYRLDLSPDGKLLLGYTGTERAEENFVNIDTQRFSVWDFISGKLIATSPDILPVQNVEFPPEMQISRSGRFVVVWWGDDTVSPNAPLVFGLP